MVTGKNRNMGRSGGKAEQGGEEQQHSKQEEARGGKQQCKTGGVG